MTTTRQLFPLYSAQQHLSPAQQRFEQTFVRGTAPTALEAAQQYLYSSSIIFSPPPLPLSPLFSINPLLYQYPSAVFVQPLIYQQQGVSFNPSYCNTTNESSNLPNTQIQFTTQPPYIPQKQSHDITEGNRIIISEDDESGVPECSENQESTKPEGGSITADLDYAVDDAETSPQQQPIKSFANAEHKTNKCFKQNSGRNLMKRSFQKSRVPKKKPYVLKRPRLIPNPHVHIWEVLPPDSPQECFKTYI